jgi:hypothetical protein
MDRDETIPPLGDELMMNWAEDLRQVLETIAHGDVPDEVQAAREVLDKLYSAAREQAEAWKQDEAVRQQAVARKPRPMSDE